MYVHRAESGHALVAGLAAVLAEPPDDPFVPDLIAVPTQGIERWLAQQLSHHLGAGASGQGDGVCANVAFPHPNDILDQAVAATSPEHAQSVQDWHPARTVWPDAGTDSAAGVQIRHQDLYVVAVGSAVLATARQALTVASATDEDGCLRHRNAPRPDTHPRYRQVLSAGRSLRARSTRQWGFLAPAAHGAGDSGTHHTSSDRLLRCPTTGSSAWTRWRCMPDSDPTR
jgi:hypothetical protein